MERPLFLEYYACRNPVGSVGGKWRGYPGKAFLFLLRGEALQEFVAVHAHAFMEYLRVDPVGERCAEITECRPAYHVVDPVPVVMDP